MTSWNLALLTCPEEHRGLREEGENRRKCPARVLLWQEAGGKRTRQTQLQGQLSVFDPMLLSVTTPENDSSPWTTTRDEQELAKCNLAFFPGRVPVHKDSLRKGLSLRHAAIMEEMLPRGRGEGGGDGCLY